MEDMMPKQVKTNYLGRRVFRSTKDGYVVYFSTTGCVVKEVYTSFSEARKVRDEMTIKYRTDRILVGRCSPTVHTGQMK